MSDCERDLADAAGLTKEREQQAKECDERGTFNNDQILYLNPD